jgi:hypothetical protein
MFQFFLGLDRYLPAFTPEFSAFYMAQANTLAELEQRERDLEDVKRHALHGDR